MKAYWDGPHGKHPSPCIRGFCYAMKESFSEFVHLRFFFLFFYRNCRSFFICLDLNRITTHWMCGGMIWPFDQFYIIFLFNGPFWELKLLLDHDYLSNLVSTCVMTLISGILVAYTMVQSTGLDEWGRETIQSQIIIIIIIIIM